MTDLIRTEFDRTSTADDVIAGIDLTGQRVLVTGASSGIGVETARALASAGAEVVLGVRRPQAGEEVAAGIVESTGNQSVSVGIIDLGDLGSVAAFVNSWSGPLDILVNNAGVMAVPELEHSPQGHELQFATNYLGHFALTIGLHDALASAPGARVVSLSSNAHWFSPVIFDDPDFAHRPYDPWSAYGQAKTADILLAVGVTRRWSVDGIFANALNPGAIATNLQRHTGGMRTPEDRRKSVPQGAATSVLLATSPMLEGVGGCYFEDCHEAETLEERPELYGGGVAPWALSQENADRLWELGTNLLG
jgi:NAD(P)-dependent dehydrogenase (short-subunit alcohol dehydrogenase family)